MTQQQISPLQPDTVDLAMLQRLEGVRRLYMLGLLGRARGHFQRHGSLYYSENAILYVLKDEPRFTEAVQEFETRTGALVYHVIRNRTEAGDMLTLLYVSRKMENWQHERNDILTLAPYAYVENLDDPLCSEGGRVCIEPKWGAILRTQ